MTKGGHGGPASGKREEEEGALTHHAPFPAPMIPSLHGNGPGTQGVGVGAK